MLMSRPPELTAFGGSSSLEGLLAMIGAFNRRIPCLYAESYRFVPSYADTLPSSIITVACQCDSFCSDFSR